MDNKKAFEVMTLVQYGNKKFLKKYIVVSENIPKNIKDLGVSEKEEFIISRQLVHEVIVK